MYRVTMICKGAPAASGASDAACIAEVFTHRPWHQNVTCEWKNGQLVLQAENDWDTDGLALIDEFSDAISACCAESFDGGIEIQSIITSEELS